MHGKNHLEKRMGIYGEKSMKMGPFVGLGGLVSAWYQKI